MQPWLPGIQPASYYISEFDFENAEKNLTNVKNPVWNLMMKNIIKFLVPIKEQEDFRFNILTQILHL
jgi:hypothetical protein